MLINLHERKESEFLRMERSIYPSKTRRNVKHVIFSIILSLVLVIELIFIGYGIGMKVNQSFEGEDWKVSVKGCSGRSKWMIENDAMKYLGGRKYLLNTKELGDYLRKNSIVSELMVRKEMPNKIYIDVKLREPFAYMVSGKGYIVAEDGVILDELNSENDVKQFPIIFVDEKDYNVQIIKKAVNVLKEVGRYDSRYTHLKEVRYDASDESFLVVLENGNLKVSGNNPENELWKYYNYRDHFQGIVNAQNTLDLRFDGQIVLKQ